MEGLGEDLGKKYRIIHTPILPILLDPYNMTPSIEVFKRVGRYDIQNPRVGYSLQHSTGVQGLELGEPISAISQTFSTDITIKKSSDSSGRTSQTFGYRPSIVRYFEFSELNTIDHQAFIQMGLPLQRARLSYGATFSMGMTPTPPTGARTKSTSTDQIFNLLYELRDRLDLRLVTGISTTKIEQPVTKALGIASLGNSTTYSFESGLSFAKNEKLSFSSRLGLGLIEQASASFATEQFGGNQTTIVNGFGIGYRKSEKLSINLAGGVNFYSSDTSGEFQPGESYELSAIFTPYQSWEFLATVGASTTIGASGLGLVTNTDYVRALVRKNVYRRITMSAGVEITSNQAQSESAIVTAISSIEQKSYTFTARIPIRKKSSINLSYATLTNGGAESLIQRDSSTSTFSFNYRF